MQDETETFKCHVCVLQLTISSRLGPRSLICTPCDRTIKLEAPGRRELLKQALMNHEKSPTDASIALHAEHMEHRAEWERVLALKKMNVPPSRHRKVNVRSCDVSFGPRPTAVITHEQKAVSSLQWKHGVCWSWDAFQKGKPRHKASPDLQSSIRFQSTTSCRGAVLGIPKRVSLRLLFRH